MATLSESSNNLMDMESSNQPLDVRKEAKLRIPVSVKSPSDPKPTPLCLQGNSLQTDNVLPTSQKNVSSYLMNPVYSSKDFQVVDGNGRPSKWRLLKIIFKFLYHLIHPSIKRVCTLESLAQDMESYKHLHKALTNKIPDKSTTSRLISVH
jgi:hypothetical protein